MNNFESVTGHDYNECIRKIESLHGKNYQELRRKYVKIGGFLGFFQKDGVQVSYMVSEVQPVKYYSSVKTKEEPAHDFARERDKILKSQGLEPVVEMKEPDNQSIQKILDEMHSIRADISEIKSTGPADEEPETIIKIREVLENNEFSPAYVRSIINRIRKEFSLTELEDYHAVESAVLKWIEESIQIDDVDSKEQPKIIILVGPTGVGKTTTVAKLAAKYSPATQDSGKSKKVNIITIDNFRIGGQDQMKTYGMIMDIPVAACRSAAQVAENIESYAPVSDTILIDTIGFSPRDFDNIARMKETLAIKGYTTAVYLAMMASTKASDMREIMKQYELFDYEDVIITKLDETGCVGNLISIVSEKKKKFAWYTIGQRVPADIEGASVSKLMGMLHGFTAKKNDTEQMFPAE